MSKKIIDFDINFYINSMKKEFFDQKGINLLDKNLSTKIILKSFDTWYNSKEKELIDLFFDENNHRQYKYSQYKLVDYLKLNKNIQFKNWFNIYFDSIENVLICDDKMNLRRLFGWITMDNNVAAFSLRLFVFSFAMFIKFIKKNSIILLRDSSIGDCAGGDPSTYELLFMNYNGNIYFHRRYYICYDKNNGKNLYYQDNISNEYILWGNIHNNEIFNIPIYDYEKNYIENKERKIISNKYTTESKFWLNFKQKYYKGLIYNEKIKNEEYLTYDDYYFNNKKYVKYPDHEKLLVSSLLYELRINVFDKNDNQKIIEILENNNFIDIFIY